MKKTDTSVDRVEWPDCRVVVVNTVESSPELMLLN